MKKSTFIDYNVIMAVLSHRKKKKPVNAAMPGTAVMEISHSNAGPEKDAPRKITVYTRELVA
jgi:hypothetical protein